jgi:YHS domain-containing protein
MSMLCITHPSIGKDRPRNIPVSQGEFRPEDNFVSGGKMPGRCDVQQTNNPNGHGSGTSRSNQNKERSINMKVQFFAIATAAIAALLATTAVAGELVNVAGASGIAVDGYDPVAFFTDAKPTNGDPGITSTYKGATYLFASKEHKGKFDADPEKYLPQYGGFCAYGAALGALFPVDISTWQVRDGKLYLNLNPAIAAEFNMDPTAFIAKAEKKWPGLVKKFGK